GGLESSVANLFSPGDRVVVPVTGYFGDRFARIAEAFHLDVRRVEYDWGRAVDVADVEEALGEAPTKGLLFQHSETSTGVINDVEPIARAAKEAGALTALDVISSAGAVPLETDAWGIDVAIGGSQKALSATPGIAFASISEAAWAAHRESTNPRFYFDWTADRKAYERENPEAPWTPAISLMLGLREALRLYLEEGAEAVLRRHELLSTATKEGVRALGLDLFGEHPERAWAVTTVRVPDGVDGKAIPAKMRADHGIIIAGGQGPLAGRVFRIGHLGYYDRFDIVRCLAALELTLMDLGYPAKPGSAVAAAEEVFARA
ncbi:MAG TPA: alanine--glyoxylate aminotransferase family protein, partial [Actinomycetota bacterium]